MADEDDLMAQAASEEGGEDQDALAAEWAAAMEESGDDGGGQDDIDAIMAGQSEPEGEAESDPDIELTQVDRMDEMLQQSPNLEVILDIPVEITMEVGDTEITIRNLLQLNQGSVIELDRLAGEPLDVKVNGTLIAHGEVVVVNEKFGIRLTDVVSPAERIRKLR